ncbi:hypothetical protein DITRI_Ditri10aG0143300 [Diplodiscus trichospermus]
MKMSTNTTAEMKKKSSRTQTMHGMWGVVVCEKDVRVKYGPLQPEACSFCGGMVQLMTIKTQWKLFFLPLFFSKKKKNYCSTCGK